MRMMLSEWWKRFKPYRERTIKTLIIGNGEVGQALREVIAPHHETHVKDIEPLFVPGIEVLQICYPDHADFIKNTKDYIKLYNPKLTIINSSVPVGTCANFDGKVIYSPVRGRHPKLASDLKIYTKFVFGNNSFARGLAMDYFRMCDLKCVEFANPTAGEVLKLLSNIHMGVEIAWRQEVDRILQHYNVPRGTFEEWEKTYQEGYLKSGDNHLVRPKMRPDPIGGHCIIPCTEILAKQFPSKIFDFVLESNEKRLREASVGA